MSEGPVPNTVAVNLDKLTADQVADGFAMLFRNPMKTECKYVHGPDFGLGAGCWFLSKGVRTCPGGGAGRDGLRAGWERLPACPK
jgi:hypothetical protein